MAKAVEKSEIVLMGRQVIIALTFVEEPDAKSWLEACVADRQFTFRLDDNVQVRWSDFQKSTEPT